MYFEDYRVGRTFETSRGTITLKDIEEYASRDVGDDDRNEPLDNWLVASRSMRLIVDAGIDGCEGSIGLSVESMEWLKPVNLGDFIRVECEVVEARPSRKRPEYGVVKMIALTMNQHDMCVQSCMHVFLVKRRPKGSVSV